MDIQNMHGLIHWLEYSGFTHNTEKYVLITNSLLVLQNENHFRKMFFWGVVQGSESDYYIAFGYQSDAIRERTFFYSENCKDWKLLPVPEKNHLILTELCQRPFQGDPGLVIEVVDDAPLGQLFSDDEIDDIENTVVEGKENPIEESPPAEEILLEEESMKNQERQSTNEIEEQPITSGELKEEDRLAALVQTVTEESFVVPRGGLFKQTDAVCVHSKAFAGLGPEEADELSSFQHYREPQQDWNTNLLVREDYNYALDFLDTIDKDVPSDCWSAQLVEGNRTIILRTLAWPGFFFFHHLSTPFYGCIYVGNGQRNLDIPFMTQVREAKVEEVLQEKESEVKSKEPSMQEKSLRSKEPSLQESPSKSKGSSSQDKQSRSRKSGSLGSRREGELEGKKESIKSEGEVVISPDKYWK